MKRQREHDDGQVEAIASRYERETASSISNLTSGDSATRPEDEHATCVLCAQCAEIDFKSAFSVPVKDGNGRAVTDLLRLTTERCDFCQMIRMMLDDGDVPHSEYETSGFHIIAHRSLTALNLKSSEAWRKSTFDNVLVITLYDALKSQTSAKVRRKGVLLGVIVPLTQPTLPHDYCLHYRGRRVESNSIDYSVPRAWIDDCMNSHQETHDACHRTAASSLPNIQVIDTVSRDIVSLPHIGDRRAGYICLSYVWGQSSAKASPAIYESCRPVRLPQIAPKTIEDAITVVTRLNERYLWVDQYCIADMEHKEKEIRSMDAIYSGAIATIVAVEGDDYNAGLHGVSTTHRRQQPQCETNAGTLVSTLPHVSQHVGKSKWYRRAWTYQETYLSRRCLFFTSSQLWFACPSLVRSEAAKSWFTAEAINGQNRAMYNARLHPDLFSSTIQEDPRHRKAKHRSIAADIKSYNGRELTFASDALDALRGVLARSKERSYWGIPIFHDIYHDTTVHFLLGLAWYVRSDTGLTHREGFPSWSWLSVTGSIYFLYIDWRDQKFGYDCQSDVTISVVSSDTTKDRMLFPRLAALTSSIVIPEESALLLLTGSIAHFWFVRFEPQSGERPSVITTCPKPECGPHYAQLWTTGCVFYADGDDATILEQQDQGVRFYGILLLLEKRTSTHRYLVYTMREKIAYRVGYLSIRVRAPKDGGPHLRDCGCSMIDERQSVLLG